MLLGGHGLNRTPWRALSHHQTVTKTNCSEMMGLLLGKKESSMCDTLRRLMCTKVFHHLLIQIRN